MSLRERWREWRESHADQQGAAEEMRFHIQLETENNLRLGMSPQEARREALKAFGGLDRFTEEARDERTGARLSDFAVSWLDWKLGFRMLMKYPGLSLLGGLTLALAIGFGAFWFELSMIEFYPRLPFDDGDRIVRIEHWDDVASRAEPSKPHDYFAWLEQFASVNQLGAYRSFERNVITSDAPPHPARVVEVSASVFTLTGVSPLLGRTFTDADAEPGEAEVALIGHDLWQDRFHGDVGILGRTIHLGHADATVIGVMPKGFGFPRSHQVWLPLRLQHLSPGAGPRITVFGRLTEGATLETAQTELSALGLRMASAHPGTHAQLRPRVIPFLADPFSDGRGQGVQMLLFTLFAWVILVVACANVAALMFARTAIRESEIVVRNALGGSRARVMGQLFVEALVLTATAALVGLTTASLAITYVLEAVTRHGVQIPFWVNDRLEPITILYTVLLAVVGAALIGLLPAIKATGTRVQAGLTNLAAGGVNMHFGGVWSVIIVLQVASTVLCLPIAIDSSREAFRDHRTRAAFPAEDFLTFRPQLDRQGSLGTTGELSDSDFNAQVLRVIGELSRRLENEPGVALTFGSALPGASHPLRPVEAQRDGEPPFVVKANTEGLVRTAAVDIRFFDTFRVPLKAGRGFEHGDVGAAHRVVIINESLARNLGGNPLGMRVREAARGEDDDTGPWHEVIGVVRNLDTEPTNRGEADFMYAPASTVDAYPPAVVLRVLGDPNAFVPRLREIAAQVDPGLRLYDLLPLGEVIRRRDAPMVQAHLGVIGVVLLAIALSAASLYALMSVAVARRTREIAIRIAVGASRTAVLLAVFRKAGLQVGAGLLVGNLLIGALAFAGYSSPMHVVLGISGAVGLVGLLACWVPARHALRIEPTLALKQDR